MLFFVSSAEERRKIRERTWAGGAAHSFAEMEDADLEFWLAMDPVDRLKMVWSLVEDGLALQGSHGPTPDFKDLMAEFARFGVRYALLRGYAVSFHGKPRRTWWKASSAS